jgi:aminopeptidase N
MITNSWAGYLNSDVTDLAVVDTVNTPGNDLLELLNANSYNKGGAVLHMLRGVLGDSVFFRGIRDHYRQHVHGVATTADFRRTMESAANRDLGWFFEQWLYRPGFPIFRTAWRWDAAAGVVVVTIEQVQKASWPTFRMPIAIDLAYPSQNVRHRVEVQGRRSEFRLPAPTQPASMVLDLEGWVLKRIE